MKPLSPWVLLAIAGLSAIVAAGLTGAIIVFGGTPLQPTPYLALLFIALSVVVIYCGRHVRRLRKRRMTWMSPIGAARTAAFARAGTFVAPLCGGFFLGLSLVALTRAEATFLLRSGIYGLVIVLAALLWCVSSAVVERWCVVEGSDGDDLPPSNATSGRPA
ncbi:DUF3180 family protein [Schaalia suimastitidis]|uniref:DUF3180 family protein n=1 Tax=Schaalia suimastitidis TaxID=121163 RepID=UPI00040B3148|nr:DUF3180 family protein [Schaalia suimastitidis]